MKIRLLKRYDPNEFIFYVLKTEYNDIGEKVKASAGDVTICSAGKGHGIENKSDETVEIIAVIVYAE